MKKAASGVLAAWLCSRTPLTAPPVKAAAALPEERHVLACLGWAGETAGPLLTLPHLSRLDLGNSYAREKAKLLKYSKAP